MAVPYYNREDLSMKLDRTICMYKGSPVFIVVNRHADPSNGVDVVGYPLGAEMIPANAINIKVSSKQFDDRSLPLGYINYNGSAYYLTRVPWRRNLQAISATNVTSTPRIPGDDRYRYFTSKAMEACILGRYPSKDEALKVLGRGATSLAISRSVALFWEPAKNIAVKFKGRHVADIVKGVVTWHTKPDIFLIQKIVDKQGIL